MAIKPIGDKILVETVKDDVEKVGSLYVPETAKEKPQQGKVIAVGGGKKEGDTVVPMTVKEGDIVIYGKYSGTEIKYDNKEYLIMSENDVLAIIG